MSNLRICQAMSLNPKVSLTKSAPGSESVSSRVCIMGCQLENPKELRRFPVHDPHRCQLWLRHFGINEKRLDQLGGLQKLRICLRHFSQREEMAKTRIKMTPLRKSTKGIMLTNNSGSFGSMGTAGGIAAGGGGGAAKMVVNSNAIQIEEKLIRDVDKPQHQTKKPLTIMPTMPQRSHSISSSASSDVQSINSDYEASLPLSTLVVDNPNGNNNRIENGQSKKRKLYLITEKSDETNGHILETNGQPKKRKMFVVVEQEKESSTGKKLMIVTDKPQADLTQHLEKLLPEILNRIQDKDKQKLIKPTPVVVKSKPVVVNNPTIITKPHITLPPKKNPTNFVKLEASPVPSNAVQMPLPMQNSKPKAMEEEESLNPEEIETNINLSPDFRFLMKILPKLEQLPEPHKQNVKRSIQIFVEKSYSIYGKKD
ncbi:uncharacterized protein LOC110189097 isoform X2 [Drosophila serrata]|nr:uncharacterized protein LOC110189097 isoform X2 [Drosophila serrata]